MKFPAVLLIAGVLMTQSAAADVIEVEIRKKLFIPAEVVIKPGDTVIWRNVEKRQYHNVWFKQFEAEEPDYLFPGDTYQRTFNEVGEFPYECAPHPKMQGLVIVKE